MADQTAHDVHEEASAEEKLRALIEKLSSYIEYYHGGSVTLVAIEDKVIKVELGGACAHCDLQPMTLKGWVEGTVRQFFPEYTVEDVGQAA